ncbi:MULTISPECIES: TIGR02587 family membrane protein [unclassified Aminobacter]|uniref:TIGR02587 family membrane protein n=1 Tax=unclassified Aminobacter TaxID=2644704 RepID=UPI000467692A|nr:MULTISPECIES: TIGR02587 family membrane protein [unclassified Aminobacter]TWG55063.1 putative integral membrane protein (TIGR02587 family) [Aminobacter sp. J44]TWH30075.1 putative integral membrane protein (TIGR02587 family) [Aminobacter sp. J15]
MATRSRSRSPATASGRALRDFGRAAGGALLFSLPMLMTIELWELGFYLDRGRLITLMLAALPMLFFLSRQIGFEKTRSWRDDVIDALIALGVAAVTSSVLLVLFGAIGKGMSADEIIGKIAIQMVPGAIGALLAKSQFGDTGDEDGAEREETYGGELFLMAVGALFLGFNMAPTEEMMLISFRMTEWHALGLVALSLALMHGFVFAVGFAGGSEVSPEESMWSAFLRLTLPGYVVALSISLFLLWIFARTDGMSFGDAVMAMVVLGFPSAIGAASARLIL